MEQDTATGIPYGHEDQSSAGSDDSSSTSMNDSMGTIAITNGSNHRLQDVLLGVIGLIHMMMLISDGCRTYVS